MINKLRKKIVAINVISVCIVFFVAVAFIFAVGYNRVDEERHNRITAALDFDFTEPDFAEMKGFEDIALAVYDTDSEMFAVFCGKNSELDKDFVTENLKEALLSPDSEGMVSLRVRFAKKTDGNLVKIVFSSTYARLHKLMPYLLLSISALVFGIGCYFIISTVLARIALKPVEESWTKQRQFVADASHELKTPLSVIMANTEILASHKDETVESQMKWIDNTRSESQRMATLVSSLLFLAKNDDGLKVQMTEVNVSECVENTVLSYDAVFYENGKKFDCDIEPDLTITGNDGQIKQLVTILLDNANKYSQGDGNIALTVCETGKYVELALSNDSEKLDEEQLSHLFDRFYTVDQSRNSEKNGNGLGLSIAKVICETHGGKISAEYENGRITFTAYLSHGKQKRDS